MAVIEYMMQLENGNLVIPQYIKDRGHWKNSANTFVGWVDDNREYYIPDTLTVLTKTKFKNRLLAMHAENPMTDGVDPVANNTPLSNTAVTTLANEWYDNFVLSNS